jgi:WD40 repeat protein
MIWNIEDGSPPTTIKGPASRVRSVAFAQDSITVMAIYDNNVAIAWNAHSGKKLWELSDVVMAEFDPKLSDMFKTYYPECNQSLNQLVTVSSDNIGRIWDVPKS